jgi:hypothetical protein
VAAFSAEDPALGRKREAALRKLAADLTGPQRAPTRIVRPKPTTSPVAVGDVVQVGADGGSRTALFVVTSLMEGYPPGSSWPVLAGLVWEGEDLPPHDDLFRLPLLRDVPLSFPNAAPVVSFRVMNGPTRGPRAFAHFGRVVASGVTRPDAPDLTMKIGPLEPEVSYSSWEGLGAFVGGEWYARCLALTREFMKPRATD